MSDEAINISEEEHEEVEPTNEHDSYVVHGDDDHQDIIGTEKPTEVTDGKTGVVSLDQVCRFLLNSWNLLLIPLLFFISL